MDTSCLSCESENELFEYFGKSLSQNDHDIFAPHESPFISEIIELFYNRGIERLDAIKEDLEIWLAGQHYTGVAAEKVPGMVTAWSKSELFLVKRYLESIPTDTWQLSDYDLLISYLFNRYTPANEMRSEADWYAVRTHLLGKVQTYINNIAPAAVVTLTSAMPLTVAYAIEQFSIRGAEKTILEYTALHAAENVVAMTDYAKHAIKNVVLDHMAKKMTGDLSEPGKLQQDLFDKFGDFNRDWRRIALSEAVECSGQGFIASLPIGARVKRIEMYRGACGFCEKINGMEFTVVSPDKTNKDPWKEMWTGKDNMGRSSSPMKRTENGGLERRTPEEFWIPTPGKIHPNCRGFIVQISGEKNWPDTEFYRWFKEKNSL